MFPAARTPGGPGVGTPEEPCEREDRAKRTGRMCTEEHRSAVGEGTRPCEAAWVGPEDALLSSISQTGKVRNRVIS